MKNTKYNVTWETTFATDNAEFTDYEKAVKFARMKKAMNYKNVKLEKVEYTELEF